MGATAVIDGAMGLGLYSTLLVVTMAAYVWSCLRARSCFRVSVQTVFHCFLLSFLCVRWVWLALGTFYATDEESPVTFVLNRLAFCLYFTSFLLVLFYWMETYHRNYIDVDGVGAFLPRLRWVFVVTVVAIYIFQLAILILFLASGEERDGDPIYDANIIADACLFLLYALLFLIYGLRILVERRDQATQLWGDMKEVWKMLVTTMIFTACFCCRVVMFLYRPVTGHYLPDTVFIFLAYYVPEVVPSALQVYIVTTSKEKAIRDNQFIEDLYSADSDEEPSDNSTDLSPTNSDQLPPLLLHQDGLTFPHVGPTEVVSSESTALLQYSRTRTSIY